MNSGHAGSVAGNTVAHQLEMERSSQSRKRGRPTGTKTSCSKPKAIRGVKARRTETTTVEGQSNPLPQVDCNANHNYTSTNSNDNATINIMASNNNYTPSNCNDSTERTSPPNCPISSNNNNNCDSPPNLSQHSTVSAHSRNSINNNSPDNSHANIQDSYNLYDIHYSTNINSIYQLDPHNRNMNDQTVNIYDNKQPHYNTTIYNCNKDNNHYYSNRHSSHTNSTEDISITANMRIESISNASNDNTQCLYTQPIYIPGSTMSHTGTGANELERQYFRE